VNSLRKFSIRYPDPSIKVNDTVKIDLATGKITDFIKFDTGAVAMVTGGRNMGRVGVITHRERHDGGFAIVHIKDAIDNSFATRESNVFVIGQEKPWISLPKGKGVKVCKIRNSPHLSESVANHLIALHL
jgi:small subunit ribosomal protein S4e